MSEDRKWLFYGSKRIRAGSTPATAPITLRYKIKEKNEMKVIAITNEKGGVGKTTTAISLGYELKKSGKSVLLIDNDPQANLTAHAGVRNPEREGYYSLTKLYEIIINDLLDPDTGESSSLPDVSKVVIEKNGFNFISSDLNLEIAERQMYVTSGTDRVMEDVIESYGKNYDYVLIDCRPSLGKLTINAMAVADSVIITLPAEHYALDGLKALLNSLKTVKKRLNHRIEIEGILFTLNQGHLRLTRDLTQNIREQLGEKINIFDAVIPASVKVKEAVAHNKAIGEYFPSNPAAEGYRLLAAEILKEDEVQ